MHDCRPAGKGLSIGAFVVRLYRLVALVLVAGSCGYHLGPAPLNVDKVTLGEVTASVGEPGHDDALRAALADGLARRGLPTGGATLSATVLAVEDQALSMGASLQQIEVRARFELATAPPRVVTLAAQEPYALAPASPLTTEHNRAAASARLMHTLAEDALVALLGGDTP